jgi:adenine-specific DNA-methyltransferase
MNMQNAALTEDPVDRIPKTKRANPAADISAQEREIDDRVYRLYGLSKDEIRMVEDSAK